jgi:hypothetical protein
VRLDIPTFVRYCMDCCRWTMPVQSSIRLGLNDAPSETISAGSFFDFSFDNWFCFWDNAVAVWGGIPNRMLLRLPKWIRHRLNEPLVRQDFASEKRGIQVRLNPVQCRPYRRYSQWGTCPDGTSLRQRQCKNARQIHSGFSLALLPGGTMRSNPSNQSAIFAAAVSNIPPTDSRDSRNTSAAPSIVPERRRYLLCVDSTTTAAPSDDSSDSQSDIVTERERQRLLRLKAAIEGGLFDPIMKRTVPCVLTPRLELPEENQR